MKHRLLSIAAVCGLVVGGLWAADPQCSARDTFTAVYLHPGPYADPGLSADQRREAADHTLAAMQRCGFDTLLCYANSTGGRAYYPSRRVPPATTVATETLSNLKRAAREHGLRVMAAVCMLNSGDQLPAGILVDHPEWALRKSDGQPRGWISPAHPEARAWLREVLVELVEASEPDGLLLDYFRYPNERDVQLDPTSAAAFDAAAPDGETPAERAVRLQRFKEESLTTLLAELRQAVAARKPDLPWGIYSWGPHVAENHPVAQPWPKWVAAGQLELVNVSGYCYRENYGDAFLQAFEQRLRDAAEKVAQSGGRTRLTFALGLKTSHGAIPRAEEIADYLRIAREVGFEGVAAFAWRGLEPMLDAVIAGGYFRDPFAGTKQAQTIKVAFEFGPDRGQNFGTLFEVAAANGQVVAGAGFVGAYNTYYRADRYTLQCFVRGTSREEVKVEPFARPSEHTHHYLYDVRGQVLAADRQQGVFVLEGGDQHPAWRRAELAPAVEFHVGGRTLACDTNVVTCDGREVFRFDPASGSAGSYYYAQGALLFHVAVANSAARQTRLYACRWNPETEPTVDIERARVLELSTPGEFPYSYGQLGDDVIVGTNTGGVYRWREGQWQTLLAPDMKTSFQLYAMLNYRDRLLMAQYPSGELFEVVGDEVRQIAGWPPRAPGASPRAREAQSLALYRGELFVGVWPWGEVWRLEPHTEQWDYVGRLFTRPEIRPEVTAPYEAELSAAGAAVNNLWGQRVTSLVPWSGVLLASTANKQGTPRDDTLEFLRDESWREYGAVHKLTLPGHISVPLVWSREPVELQFVLDARGLTVKQGGRVLGTAPSTPGDIPRFARVEYGSGVFGRFRGAKVEGK